MKMHDRCYWIAGLCLAAATLLPVMAGAQETNSPAPAAPAAPAEEKVVTTPSGLKYIDLVEGTGPMPQKGQQVTVNYTGWLEDGRKFDSSADHGKPFKFYIQMASVIRGWDEGVSTMKVGGKRKLIVPARLGYGSAGAGDIIPPNATLIFEVELIKIEGEPQF